MLNYILLRDCIKNPTIICSAQLAENLSFSVTIISATTYSTTTTITATMPFNICPDCPENDTMINPTWTG